MFGECEITPSVKKVGEIEDEWLREGWVEDVVFDEVVVNKKDGWKNHNCSGLRMINGEKHYCNRSRVTTEKGEDKTTMMVYDYAPLKK
ncbi:hypothetical protein LTS18_009898 [Coniosporium uncinatum]|uniref:Uncharacterized protein n=1 Tax=Coniosporium uncinatum TaxID=93489 RepID=A0ACC3DWG1_9PEZI|nr:hypothetical protein LTS18_009898 [Coniosporium uncinatum]